MSVSQSVSLRSMNPIPNVHGTLRIEHIITNIVISHHSIIHGHCRLIRIILCCSSILLTYIPIIQNIYMTLSTIHTTIYTTIYSNRYEPPIVADVITGTSPQLSPLPNSDDSSSPNTPLIHP